MSALLSGANIYLLFAIPIISAVAILLAFLSFRKQKKEIYREREESTRRLYELSILKELGERAGYSLNVEEILQIITGSLIQFIDYTAVGYVVLAPEKVKLNIHIEKSVGQPFLAEMRKKMIDSLSALTDGTFDDSRVEELVSGALVADELKQTPGSLFNIPLVISGAVAGVLTVAHAKPGLYKEEDMTILYKITGQASEAVSRLQEVVRMEQGKLNAMVSSMGDGVLMVDPEYRVMVANPAIKKIIKFDAAAKGDKEISIFDFVDALGGKFDIHGRVEEVAAKGEPYISDRINIDDAFYEIGVYPVTHSTLKGKNQKLGVVVAFHDVTRDIELERVREEFTSMIVHELRSPLDGIKKMIELIISGKVKVGSAEFGEYLTLAYQSSGSMLEMVNDILDLSKLQAGKFEVNKEKADIKEVIENRLSFYRVSADSKEISLKGSFSANLPVFCDFDSQAVKQILNNLISNALKFTPAAGSVLISAFALKPGENPPPDIMASNFAIFPKVQDFALEAPSLCVVVSDTGAGIAAENLKELFHTYKQVKVNFGSENKGTGLGLVIAKSIAEAHGGRVGVVSKEGVGSSFYFTIPL